VNHGDPKTTALTQIVAASEYATTARAGVASAQKACDGRVQLDNEYSREGIAALHSALSTYGEALEHLAQTSSVHLGSMEPVHVKGITNSLSDGVRTILATHQFLKKESSRLEVAFVPQTVGESLQRWLKQHLNPSAVADLAHNLAAEGATASSFESPAAVPPKTAPTREASGPAPGGEPSSEQAAQPASTVTAGPGGVAYANASSAGGTDPPGKTEAAPPDMAKPDTTATAPYTPASTRRSPADTESVTSAVGSLDTAAGTVPTSGTTPVSPAKTRGGSGPTPTDDPIYSSSGKKPSQHRLVLATLALLGAFGVVFYAVHRYFDGPSDKCAPNETWVEDRCMEKHIADFVGCVTKTNIASAKKEAKDSLQASPSTKQEKLVVIERANTLVQEFQPLADDASKMILAGCSKALVNGLNVEEPLPGKPDVIVPPEPLCEAGSTKACACGSTNGTSRCRDGGWSECICLPPIVDCSPALRGAIVGKLTECGAPAGTASVHVDIDWNGKATVRRSPLANSALAKPYEACIAKIDKGGYPKQACSTTKGDPITFKW
jgi:hypothetical protein